MIHNLEKFYHSREEVIMLDYAKMMLDAGYHAKQNETKQGEQDLKY